MECNKCYLEKIGGCIKVIFIYLMSIYSILYLVTQGRYEVAQ